MNKTNKIINLPNVLTISRILLLPVFILGFYLKTKLGLLLSLSIFILCCITDYLDGYIARTYNQTTELGKILDPMADKILVFISILCILCFNMVSKWALIPSAINICRDLIITSLRNIISTSGGTFKTSYLAKCKTAAQMISIVVILLFNIISLNKGIIFGELLLWISAIIAIVSGIKYCSKFVSN